MMKFTQKIMWFLLIWLLMLTSCAPRKTPGALALVGVCIIDGTGGPPLEAGTLLIATGKIVALGQALDIPEKYEVIDLSGKTVLPGFINSHVHAAYDKEALRHWLRAGVTSVRDLGPHVQGDFLSLRDKLNRDPYNARLISATPLLTAPGGYGGEYLSSPEEAEEVVHSYIDRGVDVIKIAIEDSLQGRAWRLLEREELLSITRAAHSRGIRVSAHVSHASHVDLALEAGVDDLAHMIVDPLTPAQAEAVIQQGLFWVPTLELWNGISQVGYLYWITNARENLKLFHRMGGKVALGTDFGGYTTPFESGLPVTEIRLMQEAEMSPMAIIVAATKHSAIVCGRGDSLGTLEPGKIADLLIVTGNPLEDLTLLSEPFLILKDGIILKE